MSTNTVRTLLRGWVQASWTLVHTMGHGNWHESPEKYARSPPAHSRTETAAHSHWRKMARSSVTSSTRQTWVGKHCYGDKDKNGRWYERAQAMAITGLLPVAFTGSQWHATVSRAGTLTDMGTDTGRISTTGTGTSIQAGSTGRGIADTGRGTGAGTNAKMHLHQAG